MADKILGRDHTDDTAPAGTYTITADTGTANKDVLLSNLYKALGTGTPDSTKALFGDGSWTVAVTSSGTVTLTNKRITPRVVEEASSATPTINTDNCDIFQVTALAAAITSMTTNLSGTPTDGQSLDIEILDNGTARAITWGASFASTTGATLPTTTTLSKWLYVKLRWSASRSKWMCLSVVNEA